MKGLQTEAKYQETRAVKAEGEFRSAQDLVQVMSDQVEAICAERDQLREDLEVAQGRVSRRTEQLKASRKALRKEKKRLEHSEERIFTTTYAMMVLRVADAGLDHKLVLLQGLDDPVGKEVVPEEHLVVSFDTEEDLSD